jgi:hypothetical protein
LEAFFCFLALKNSVLNLYFITNLIHLIMRKLILFSAIFTTFLMSCSTDVSRTIDPTSSLSISGKINCPSRTLTTLNPSEYLITLVDSTGVTRTTRPTADCKYSFDSLEMGHNYNIKIVRTVPSANLTVSATALEAYLSQNPLPQRTDLGLIAADVDKSGEVDATDLLHVKRFVSGVTITLPSESGLWRFVPSVWLTSSNNFIPNTIYGAWNIRNLTTNVDNYDLIQVQYSDIDLLRCN